MANGPSSDGKVMEDESSGRERERRGGEKGESGEVERGSGAAMLAENDAPVEQESPDGGEEGGQDGGWEVWRRGEQVDW